MRYAIGSRVRVQVSRVDLDGRRIDFRLIHEGEALTSRAMKDKGALREGGSLSDLDSRLGGKPVKRASRKISEPLARAPRSVVQSVKTVERKAAVKNKDKGKKPRRR